jgi:hypothetical protein
MEFVYDYTEDMISNIIKNALIEGYIIRCSGWLNEWEREEGCPSEEYDIDPQKRDSNECFIDSHGMPVYELPEYPQDGCREWNFVKDDKYITFFHTEKSNTYINQEAIDNFYTVSFKRTRGR